MHNLRIGIARKQCTDLKGIYYWGHDRIPIPNDWEGYEAADSQIEVLCPIDIGDRDEAGNTVSVIADCAQLFAA